MIKTELKKSFAFGVVLSTLFLAANLLITL